jgi:hypothetical protein
MTARLLKFPDFFRPATRHDEPCLIVKLPAVRAEVECPKVQELRRQSKLLREHFRRQQFE